MTETIPYQHGMLLGRTYDLRSHTVGSDIFPTDYTANPDRHLCPSTKINYKVIKNSSDVNDLLEVSGNISLKVKAGILKVQGMGSYLKDIRKEETALEILAVAHVETACTTLQNPTLPGNWNKENVVGSHYIRTIIYGGELIIKISLIATDSKQKEEIKGRVSAMFPIHGIVNVEGAASLRQMEHDLKEKTEIKFSYYGTTQCTKIPTDMDSMLQTLNDFPNQLTKINDGLGAPLRCELVPLKDIDPSFPSFLRQTGLETQMRELEDQYDDIRQSHAMLRSCLEIDADHMTTEQEEKGNEIEIRIHTVKTLYDRVIALLGVTTDGDSLHKIEDAVNFYRTNKKAVNFRTETHAPIEDFPKGRPLRIILVGVTGHGKSATANSIFGEYKFNTHMGCESIWNGCHMEHGTVGGREIDVMDTPGSIYIDISGLKLVNHYDPKLIELKTAFKYQPKGYHAILFVLSIDVRIRNGDLMAIKMLKKKFGYETLKNYGIIIFTHGDSFERNMTKYKRETSFEEYINSDKSLQENVLKECKNRYTLIDNLEQDPGRLRDQVIGIIELIDRLVEDNKGVTYKWTG
ncbi:hypothetical protein ACJMK2_008795 [Sinanodonta woodiana]|uniref:AIG1-type G domain-containing protein n=1 Tax=Sinanodonta woodiana TaxID=1069815 RepID=A0ABD3VMM1_SINWO